MLVFLCRVWRGGRLGYLRGEGKPARTVSHEQRMRVNRWSSE